MIREYSRNGRYAKAARKYLETKLQTVTIPVLLVTVTYWADEGAREAGMKAQAIWDSIWDYTHLLPDGWTAKWLTGDSGESGFAMAVPLGWESAPPADSLTVRMSSRGIDWREATMEETRGLFD